MSGRRRALAIRAVSMSTNRRVFRTARIVFLVKWLEHLSAEIVRAAAKSEAEPECSAVT